ncbi:MAG TPA: YfhO family protein [Candidatus Hydrogenedens sp.]|nr:YfhO family protein [Candidatus Hydrogenedens sp.]
MSNTIHKVSEFRRFPFWGTMLGGLFLLLIIRIYWDPTLLSNVIQTTKSETWAQQQYTVWGPIWKYGFGQIEKGEIPHWNPYQLCGQPYLTDIRTSLFQPLHLIFWRTDFAYAYQWYIFLCLSLIGIGFLLWGRILEIPYPALLPGLVSLLFSGPVICAQMSLPYLSGSVWLLFLLSGISYFVENYTVRSFFVLSFLWTALVLSGSIECIITGIFVLILFPFFFRTFPMLTMERSPISTIWKVLGILLLGLMISAFSWFPLVMWFLQAGVDYKSIQSFPLSAVFPETFLNSIYQFVLPIIFTETSELPILYPGLIGLIFIPPAFFDRELRSVVVFHSLILLSFFLLFFVDLSLAHILQQGMLILFAVSFSTLSGIGFYRLLLKGRNLRSPYVWVSGIFVFLISVIIILIGNPWIKGVSILLLIFLIPATLIRVRKINVIICIIISLLSFIELYYLFRPYLPDSYISAIEKYDSYSEFVKQLRYQTGTGRGLIISNPNTVLWSENIGMYYHWQLVNGAEILKDRYSQSWFQSVLNGGKERAELLTNPFITLSGVQWAFIPTIIGVESIDTEALKHWRKMEHIPFVDIFENTQSIPRCFWVPNCQIAPSDEEVKNILMQSNFSPLAECVLKKDSTTATLLGVDSLPIESTPPTEQKDDSNSQAVASIQEETAEKIAILVKAPKKGLLVLLDTFSEGWKATLDGEPVEIFRTNGIFRSVSVPDGSHQVIFTYTTPGWNAGRITSLAGVVLSFLALSIGSLRSTKDND